MSLHFKHIIHKIVPVFFCIILILLLAACDNSIRITSAPIITPTSVPTIIPAIGTRTAQMSVTVTDTSIVTITPFKSQPEFGCFNNLTLPKQTGRIIWPSDLQLYADSICKKAVRSEGNKGSGYLLATLPAPISQEGKYSLTWNMGSPNSEPIHGQKIAFTRETQKYVELTLPTTFAKGQCLQVKVPANTYHIVWKQDLIVFQGKTCSISVSMEYQVIDEQAHDIMADPTTAEGDYAILKN